MSDSLWWPVEVALPDGQLLRGRLTGQEWVLGAGWCCRVEVAVWDWVPPRLTWVSMLAPRTAVRRVPGVEYQGVPAHNQYVLEQDADDQMILHYQRCPLVRDPASEGVVIPDGAARESLVGRRTTPCSRCSPVAPPDEVRASVDRAAARARPHGV